MLFLHKSSCMCSFFLVLCRSCNIPFGSDMFAVSPMCWRVQFRRNLLKIWWWSKGSAELLKLFWAYATFCRELRCAHADVWWFSHNVFEHLSALDSDGQQQKAAAQTHRFSPGVFVRGCRIKPPLNVNPYIFYSNGWFPRESSSGHQREMVWTQACQWRTSIWRAKSSEMPYTGLSESSFFWEHTTATVLIRNSLKIRTKRGRKRWTACISSRLRTATP